MKFKLITAILTTALLSFNASAYLTCEDQGYVYTSAQFNVTSNWVSNIAGHSVGTFTDGILNGVTAAAYEFGLKDWNAVYKGNWCTAKESAMTSTIPPYGSSYPIAGTFHCQWFDEPTSNADVTSIITLNYCRHPGTPASKY